jgi:enoyl-CoA hydratase/carnithine racemase
MIEVSVEGRLRRITLARPDKANALTGAMLRALEAAFAEAAVQASVVILTGAGKVFSAGADLDEMQAGLGADPVWDRVSAAIAGFPGLVIAALNGTLAGGAFGLALACDMRLSVPGTRFFYPVMRLGYLPQPADPWRLAALIGPSRAAMILLGGARIEADEALSWGLVDRIVEPDGLMAAAGGLAADALAADPAHLAAIKAMVPRR